MRASPPLRRLPAHALLLACAPLLASAACGPAAQPLPDDPERDAPAQLDPNAPPQDAAPLLKDVAAGQRPITDLIDPTHGVVFIEYTPASADAPAVQRARRLCGAELEAPARAWTEALRAEPELVECEPLDCGLPGAEGVATLYVIFEPGPRGLPVIESVLALGEADLDEAGLEAMDAFIEPELETLRANPLCP